MGYSSQTAIANREGFENTFTNSFSANQSGGNLITPGSGKYLSIKGVFISTASNSGSIRLYFSDDENDEENTVVEVHSITNGGYIPLYINGDRDAVLKIDSSAGDNEYFVLVNYTEE